jgi:hypothetical protein
MSEYLQQQGLLQQGYSSNGQVQPNSLEALLRNTALVQQLQNNAGGLSQSASSNSLAGQYAQEPQMRASGSSGNLSMGGNSPPQLSSNHGSHQYLNQAQLSSLSGIDGQYGLGRRTPGGMSMSTGDLAALYEAAQVHCQILIVTIMFPLLSWIEHDVLSVISAYEASLHYLWYLIFKRYQARQE